MKNPKELKTSTVAGAGDLIYAVELPTYKISPEGMKDGRPITLPFCKGTIGADTNLIQEGVFTESLLQASLEFLSNVNRGPLQNIDTTEAIQHIKAALGCLGRRHERRAKEGTAFTNKV